MATKTKIFREYLGEYLRANKKAKGEILDHVCFVTKMQSRNPEVPASAIAGYGQRRETRTGDLLHCRRDRCLEGCVGSRRRGLRRTPTPDDSGICGDNETGRHVTACQRSHREAAFCEYQHRGTPRDKLPASPALEKRHLRHSPVALETDRADLHRTLDGQPPGIRADRHGTALGLCHGKRGLHP
jgi:hypothetical protein